MYRIDWFNSESDISLDFWQRCFPEPLEGQWWYRALEQCGIEEQFKFAYGLIYRGSQRIGIITTFVMDVPIELVAPPTVASLIRKVGSFMPSLQYQRTLFIGSPCAEEGTVGLIPEVNLSDLVEFLQESLEHRAHQVKAPMIVWKDFSEFDRVALASLAERKGMFPLVSYPGTMVALEDRTKETYFANLKGSRRHNLKKKLKKSRQNLTADIEVVQNPDPKTMDEIFSLFWQTYEKGKTKFERLNPLFFSKVAEFEGSYFVLVRDSKDKKMVAFMLCFNVGDRVINKFIGIDYSLPAECYLYFRLYEAALDWVLTTKAVEFQSGQTGYRAKIDLGNSLVPLTNYCKHRNPLMNRIYALVSQDVSWLTLDEDLATYLKAHPEEMLPLPKLPAPAPKTPAICNR